MPGNMWDNSDILLSNNSGQNIAQGIQQAGAAFSQGVQRYFQKKEQDKKEEATVQWLEQSGAANNLFPQLATVKDPGERRKIISAGIKGAGLDNMVQVAQFSAQQERQKQEAEAMAELRKSQAAENLARQHKLEQEIAAGNREDGAMKAAFDPIKESNADYGARGGYVMANPAPPAARAPVPAEMVQRYGAAGGRNPAVIKQLNDLSGPEDLTNLQFQEDPVTGERFAVSKKGSVAKSGANPTKTPPLKPGISAPVEVQIGPRKLFYHPDSKRYFDERGQPVVFPSGSDVATAEAIKNFGAEDSATNKQPAAATPAGGDVPTVTPEQARALPKGTKFRTTDGRILVKS
jgi:hypothetical protein